MPLGDPFLGIAETIQGGFLYWPPVPAPQHPGHYKMKNQLFLEPELVQHLSGGESPWGTF